MIVSASLLFFFFILSNFPEINSNFQRELVQHFSSFQTRNTNTKELDQAVHEIAERVSSMPGIEVEHFEYDLAQSPRVPEAKRAIQVVATLPGADSKRIIVGAHLDSLNISKDIFNARAPGANDDLSGVAVVMECARILSSKKWKHTLQFVIFTGEEQGLCGSTALAKHSKSENWEIIAVLNNDTVGSARNRFGEFNNSEVRLFSDQSNGSQSQELARFIDWLSRIPELKDSIQFDPALIPVQAPEKSNEEDMFRVKLVHRLDRFGRGGDHIPFSREGFSSVRWIEVCEDVSVQHTIDDTAELMDFEYLAKVTRLNLLAISSLAESATPPANPTILRSQSRDTTLRWDGDPSETYIVYWRDTRSSSWESWKIVAGLETTIEKINKDDHIFAVAALGGIPIPFEQLGS